MVPSILVEQFKLTYSLINMMTSDQFFGLEKDNPHDHIRWFNKITSTIKYKDVPNSAIKLMLFPFSLVGAARRWLEKEPPRSILTWEDLVSKFINEFFPPSRTTNLRNEISNFQQRFDESFYEVWDRYKDLLHACPDHGFTKLHQLDAFYNALNPADQDSLNSGTGGNLLERHTQDVLMIIEKNLSAPLSELEKFKRMNEANMKAMKTQINNMKNELRNEMKNSIHASMSNQTNELKNMMASFFQMSTASTLGSGSLPSNTIANSKGELKAITTRSAVILKKLPKKLRDPGKFLIPCGFSELKCKALANLGASINLMPLFVWKKLDLPELISTRMTLELANRAICTPAEIARDVFIPVGKFTFPTDFFIVDYESDPRVPLILGRPFLQTAHALIDVHRKEMIFRDGDERLTLNMRHDTSSYSNQPQKESINMINIFNDLSGDFLENLFSTNHHSVNLTFSSHPELTSSEVKDDIFDPEGGNFLPEKLQDLDSTKDLHPPHHVNPLSDSTTSYSSPNHLLEEFVDELALITFPPGNDDLPFDIESDLKEIEYLLHHDPIKDMDSILEDSVDEDNLVDLNDDLVDTMPEMFTDKHALDYSSPTLYDEYNDDLFKVKSDTEYVYDDPFDSRGEKIKESKLLIDELDLLSDFLPFSDYDSFLFEDFSEVDALPSTNNEDKVFNL
nr:reverse transcriptase domain-containing protein [Tanacetum cinerariifolium]